MKKILLISSVITVIALATLSVSQNTNASASSPANGYSGAPMDNSGQTCTACHGGTATQTTGVIFSNIPGSGYIGGTTYNFTVTMSGATAYGFELTPQTTSSSVGLGTWIAGTGCSVSTKYIKQSTKKTGASATWVFQWTAPTTATTVTFFGSFNYANNNSSTSGDVIKKSSITYFANTTSINESVVENELVSVFPNPTTSELHVMVGDKLDNASIYTLDGKLAKTISEQELIQKTISVNELNNGIYFLYIKSRNKNLVTKFAKN